MSAVEIEIRREDPRTPDVTKLIRDLDEMFHRLYPAESNHLVDIETILASVHKTGRLLIVDENFQPCGVGAEIAGQVVDQAFDDLDAPIKRLNGAHTPVPYSPTLEGAIVPTIDTIEQTIRDLLAE